MSATSTFDLIVANGFTGPITASTINGTTPSATGLSILAAANAAAVRAITGTGNYSTIQAANQVVTNSTTFVDSVNLTIPLGVGTYWCEANCVILNSSTTGLSKIKCNFTGTATAAATHVDRAFATDVDGNGLYSQFLNAATGVEYNTSGDNFGTNRSQLMHRRFRLVVTVAGTLSVQFAMVVASGGGDTATLAKSSYLTAFQE